MSGSKETRFLTRDPCLLKTLLLVLACRNVTGIFQFHIPCVFASKNYVLLSIFASHQQFICK